MVVYVNLDRDEVVKTRKIVLEAVAKTLESQNYAFNLNKINREKSRANTGVASGLKEISLEIEKIKSMLPEEDKKPVKKSEDKKETIAKKNKYEIELEEIKKKIEALK